MNTECVSSAIGRANSFARQDTNRHAPKVKDVPNQFAAIQRTAFLRVHRAQSRRDASQLHAKLPETGEFSGLISQEKKPGV